MRRSITIIALLCLLWCWLPSAQAQVPAVGLNRSAPGARGLVAWWKAVSGFTGGPRWYDLTGRSHGTLTNMGTTGAGSGWARTNRPGGTAHVRCDGTNDYVSFVPPTLTGGKYTIMFWARDAMLSGKFNLDMFTGGNRFSLSLNKGNWGGDEQAISFLENSTYTNNLSPPFSVLANVWQHIAVTLNAATGTSRGYINGVERGSAGYGETFGGAGTLMVWCTKDTLDNFAQGDYDDLRLYGVALTADEVWRSYVESLRGDPALLPPSPLMALLGSVPVAGNAGSFLPFFQPAQ